MSDYQDFVKRGELYLVDGVVYILTELEETPFGAKGVLHALDPLENVLIHVELMSPTPFRGRTPADWLESKKVSMSN